MPPDAQKRHTGFQTYRVHQSLERGHHTCDQTAYLGIPLQTALESHSLVYLLLLHINFKPLYSPILPHRMQFLKLLQLNLLQT